MSDFKGRSTAELQAEYDAGIVKVRAIREKLEPIKQELSRRCDAQAFVINQVIAGNAAALRQNGVPEEVVAAAEAHFAAEKDRKAKLRAARAAGAAGVAGGAS